MLTLGPPGPVVADGLRLGARRLDGQALLGVLLLERQLVLAGRLGLLLLGLDLAALALVQGVGVGHDVVDRQLHRAGHHPGAAADRRHGRGGDANRAGGAAADHPAQHLGQVAD